MEIFVDALRPLTSSAITSRIISSTATIAPPTGTSNVTLSVSSTFRPTVITISSSDNENYEDDVNDASSYTSDEGSSVLDNGSHIRLLDMERERLRMQAQRQRRRQLIQQLEETEELFNTSASAYQSYVSVE